MQLLHLLLDLGIEFSVDFIFEMVDPAEAMKCPRLFDQDNPTFL